MSNLIYQYWDGDLTSGAIAGSKTMKKYADKIGVEYIFEHNPRFRTDLGKYSPHYGQFKVVWDPKFFGYDKIFVTDTDVFPIETLTENVFDGFEADIGICTEPYQPKARQKSDTQINTMNDEKWAAMLKTNFGVEMPRTDEGLLKVYNSGVLIYTKAGMEKMRKNCLDFKKYVNLINSYGLPDFYTADQNYIHAMLKVADLNYVELDNGWNSYVHYIGHSGQVPRPVNDMRTKNTKMVHIQLRAADHYDEQKLWRITNLPESEWRLNN